MWSFHIFFCTAVRIVLWSPNQGSQNLSELEKAPTHLSLHFCHAEALPDAAYAKKKIISELPFSALRSICCHLAFVFIDA
jgi:hypothetical protein